MIKKVIEIAAQVFEGEINETSDQKNCLKWDSLRHLNFIIELEDAFDISFEPEEIAQMKSIQNVVNFINTKLN